MYTLITHGNCPDGFCAAYLAQKYLPVDDILFLRHDEPAPFLPDKDVICVDVSWSATDMIYLASAAKSFVLLDHHATAIQELAGLAETFAERPEIQIVLDNRFCGAMLLEHWLADEAQQTIVTQQDFKLVQYVQDRDLWRWELRESKAISAAMLATPWIYAQWEMFALDLYVDHDDIVRIGNTILMQNTKQIAMLLDQKQWVTHFYGGAYDRVYAVNTPLLHSEVGNHLAEMGAYGITYFQQADGRWKYSLRSTAASGIDVSKIAAVHGGGGHPRASGFTLDRLILFQCNT